MRKLLHDRRGFTLVELSVTMLIAVILIAVICSIFFSSSRLVQTHIDAREAQAVGDTISNLLADQLTYATELQTTSENEPLLCRNVFSVKDGRLMLQTTDKDNNVQTEAFYDEQFYLGTKIGISTMVKNERWLWYRVTVYGEDDKTQLYQTENTIEIVNMRLAKLANANTGYAITDSSDGLINTAPLICFNSDRVVQAGAVFSAPSKLMVMYEQTVAQFRERVTQSNALTQNTGESWADYNNRKTTYIKELFPRSTSGYLNNEDIRYYILNTLSDNDRWPLFNSNFVSCISFPNSLIKETDELEIQCHVQGGDVVYYAVKRFSPAKDDAQRYNEADWTPLVIYNRLDGKWYTRLPTLSNPVMRDMITVINHGTDAFYENIQQKWNVLE